MERRSQPRVNLELTARVACVSERIPPAVSVVDVSLAGALVAFPEPIGFVDDERVVVSFDILPDPTHLLGRVVRVARGDDFRSYVAIRFDEDQAHETARLQRALTEQTDERSDAEKHEQGSEPTAC